MNWFVLSIAIFCFIFGWVVGFMCGMVFSDIKRVRKDK